MHDDEPTSVSATTNRKASAAKPPPISKGPLSDISSPKLCYIALDRLIPDPDNVRQNYKGIEAFAEAIREDGGITQSLLVRPHSDGNFVIIAGHRRYKAAMLLGLKEVPVTIREVTDEEKDALQISENINRSDVSAIELAHRLDRMIERCPSDDGSRVDKVAKRLNRSPNLVRRYVALLKLDTSVVESLESNRLGISQATEVARLARARKIPQALELARSLKDDASKNAAPSAKPKDAPDAPRVFEKRCEGFTIRVTFTSMAKDQEAAFRSAVHELIANAGGAQ